MIGHLIKDSVPLELFAWRDSEAALTGWDILTGNPFGTAMPEDHFTPAQNYFAEYHLEYYRQRVYGDFPSRLHAQLLFATPIDAENFRTEHPSRVQGKNLVCVRSKGTYVVSFHDSSWLDYLRLPHSLSLSVLDEVSNFYWKGALVQEANLTFMNSPWKASPIIEAIFQGDLEPSLRQPPTLALPRLG